MDERRISPIELFYWFKIYNFKSSYGSKYFIQANNLFEHKDHHEVKEEIGKEVKEGRLEYLENKGIKFAMTKKFMRGRFAHINDSHDAAKIVIVFQLTTTHSSS